MVEKNEIYLKPDFSEEDGYKAAEIEERFATMNGWEAESDAEKLLHGLKLKETDFSKSMKDLVGDDKVKVIVATDVKTKEYICGTGDSVELRGKLVAKVVATANPLFLGKIALMFGVDSADKNTAPHPLHFGCCLWSPTIVTDIQRSVNGTTIKVCNNIPRFLHVVNVPVMSMLTISDYKTVLGKLAVKFDQI